MKIVLNNTNLVPDIWNIYTHLYKMYKLDKTGFYYLCSQALLYMLLKPMYMLQPFPREKLHVSNYSQLFQWLLPYSTVH